MGDCRKGSRLPDTSALSTNTFGLIQLYFIQFSSSIPSPPYVVVSAPSLSSSVGVYVVIMSRSDFSETRGEMHGVIPLEKRSI
jgi:hypothetical protein